MQTSCHSDIAMRLADWLRSMPVPHKMRALLADITGDLAADSAAAAFVEIWLSRHLGPAIARQEGASDAVLTLLEPYDHASLAAWIGAQTSLAPEILTTLGAAWADCERLMGDPAGWQWGRVHRLHLRHPLHRLAPDHWSMPDIARGGSSSSPNYAGYRPGDLGVEMGPSVRMLIDIGAWDNSLFVNSPGQSGIPGSPHYDDLTGAWAAGDYHPLLYSDAAIDGATAARITLRQA